MILVLDVLKDGIDEGRKTFANALKYILTTISANFGNMLSMALTSLFLPFLPLLASQILLNNFLSDIPATTITSDNVDSEWGQKPHRWNTKFIRNFIVIFGLVSLLFDFLNSITFISCFAGRISYCVVYSIVTYRTRRCTGSANALCVFPQSSWYTFTG